MNNQAQLLTLLIHRRTRERYYKEHEQFVEKRKKIVESIRGEPFEAMAEDKQMYYLDGWFWPPWRFNDIVGYIEIEMETPWTVIGHLYTKPGRPAKGKPFLLDYACASTNCEPGNLNSLREAIVEVVHDIHTLIGKKWKIEFDRSIVDHTDYISMLKARGFEFEGPPMKKIYIDFK